jgi:hypothetical protein
VLGRLLELPEQKQTLPNDEDPARVFGLDELASATMIFLALSHSRRVPPRQPQIDWEEHLAAEMAAEPLQSVNHDRCEGT